MRCLHCQKNYEPALEGYTLKHKNKDIYRFCSLRCIREHLFYEAFNMTD